MLLIVLRTCVTCVTVATPMQNTVRTTNSHHLKWAAAKDANGLFTVNS